MYFRIYFCIACCWMYVSCSPKKASGEVRAEDFSIIRMDNLIYQYVTQNENLDALSVYKTFLDEYGEKVIDTGRTDSAGFYNRLKNNFSEPALLQIYTDEQTAFSDVSAINKELSGGMKTLLQYFPDLLAPQIYMHVSGLNQNVIVGDNLLSLSADKYLGQDYPIYKEFFYEYQRQLMSPDRVVPDYLLGFLMANFPFQGNEEVLLDRMLYEGKLRWFLSQLLPKRQPWEWVGYTKAQYQWCSERQARIWKSVLEQQHLFRPDYLTTTGYLKDAPYTASLPEDSPGRVGIWLGYQMIAAYMKNHSKTTWTELMMQTDYPALLQEAKFKP